MQKLVRQTFSYLCINYLIIYPPNIDILVMQVSKLQIKHAINCKYSSNQLLNMMLLMHDLIHTCMIFLVTRATKHQ